MDLCYNRNVGNAITAKYIHNVVKSTRLVITNTIRSCFLTVGRIKKIHGRKISLKLYHLQCFDKHSLK